MELLQLTSEQLTKRKADFFLSENALIFPEDIHSGNKIVVADFWNDNEKIKAFKKEILEHYNRMLPQLALFLNDIHGEDKDKLYWERLTGFWLYSIISNFLEKIKRIEKAFESKKDWKIISIHPDAFQTPLNTKEYFHALRGSVWFHLQQYSIILKEYYPNNLDFAKKEWNINEDSSSIVRGSHKKSVKQILKQIIIDQMDKGYESDVAIYVALFSNKELQKLFIKSKGKIAPIIKNREFEISRIKNYELRRKIEQFSTNKTKSDIILFNIVKYFFPIELLEGYKEIKQDVEKLISKKIPRLIITGIGWTWNTHFAIWAARCASKGTKVAGVQHGGTYGEVEQLQGEFLERKLSDIYLTWGWRENEKTIPMPAPRLMSRTKIKTKPNDEIIWVTTADCRFNYFVGNIVFGTRFLLYFEHQKRLYQNIDPEIRKKIKIRLYPDDFGWKLKERWKTAFPDVQFASNQESFLEQIKKANLVIIDHFGGTTTLETLAMGVPIIIAGHPELFEVRKSAKPFYDKLMKQQIIHTSYKNATDTINENYSNLNAWWNDRERQKNIDVYMNNFARIEPDGLMESWWPFMKKT